MTTTDPHPSYDEREEFDRLFSALAFQPGTLQKALALIQLVLTHADGLDAKIRLALEGAEDCLVGSQKPNPKAGAAA